MKRHDCLKEHSICVCTKLHTFSMRVGLGQEIIGREVVRDMTMRGPECHEEFGCPANNGKTRLCDTS